MQHGTDAEHALAAPTHISTQTPPAAQRRFGQQSASFPHMMLASLHVVDSDAPSVAPASVPGPVSGPPDDPSLPPSSATGSVTQSPLGASHT
jgi:hypothetical protein